MRASESFSASWVSCLTRRERVSIVEPEEVRVDSWRERTSSVGRIGLVFDCSSVGSGIVSMPRALSRDVRRASKSATLASEWVCWKVGRYLIVTVDLSNC